MATHCAGMYAAVTLHLLIRALNCFLGGTLEVQIFDLLCLRCLFLNLYWDGGWNSAFGGPFWSGAPKLFFSIWQIKSLLSYTHTPPPAPTPNICTHSQGYLHKNINYFKYFLIGLLFIWLCVYTYPLLHLMICFAYHNLEPLLGFNWKLDHMDEIDNTSNAKSMDEIWLNKINVLTQQIVMACGWHQWSILHKWKFDSNILALQWNFVDVGFMDEVIQWIKLNGWSFCIHDVEFHHLVDFKYVRFHPWDVIHHSCWRIHWNWCFYL